MKELAQLRPIPGAVKTRKRVGRGPGSGLGKTSGKGHKGEKSRSGKGKPPWFEGGQMPLQRRIPKRGFRPIRRKEYTIINVGDLEVFEDGAKVDPAMLKAAGLIRKEPVKLLGDGDLTRKLDVTVHSFSATAKEKIEKAGGKVQLAKEE